MKKLNLIMLVGLIGCANHSVSEPQYIAPISSVACGEVNGINYTCLTYHQAQEIAAMEKAANEEFWKMIQEQHPELIRTVP